MEKGRLTLLSQRFSLRQERDALLASIQQGNLAVEMIVAPMVGSDAYLGGIYQQYKDYSATMTLVITALFADPDILLLDEPTASLDFRAAQQIEALLAELASRYTLVVVSHSLSQAHRLAAQMFVLREGVGVDAVPAALFGNSEALLEAMDRLI